MLHDEGEGKEKIGGECLVLNPTRSRFPFLCRVLRPWITEKKRERETPRCNSDDIKNSGAAEGRSQIQRAIRKALGDQETGNSLRPLNGPCARFHWPSVREKRKAIATREQGRWAGLAPLVARTFALSTTSRYGLAHLLACVCGGQEVAWYISCVSLLNRSQSPARLESELGSNPPHSEHSFASSLVCACACVCVCWNKGGLCLSSRALSRPSL